MYSAEILADSVGPHGVRYTSFLITYPHAVHKDILRHRVHASSYLSFRAFPTAKLDDMLEDDYFVPEVFQEFRKGMDVGEGVSASVEHEARKRWRHAKQESQDAAIWMIKNGINKGHANILIQDFCWITGIVSGTEWGNFWALRAKPPSTSKPRAEVMKIAGMMHDLYQENEPRYLDYGKVHLPLIRDEDYAEVADIAATDGEKDAEDILIKVTTGRCARTSYLTHDGVRDMEKDFGLHDSLLVNRHMSPFDHPAWPIPLTEPKYVDLPDPRVGSVVSHGRDWRGHLFGWCPYRYTIDRQYDFSLVRDEVEAATT